MVRHIGFTGTRYGMTNAQRRVVDFTLADIIGGDVKLRVVAHHGDCVGADAKFHELARQYGCAVCIHPPTDTTRAANIPECVNLDGTRVVRLAPLPYMARNREIVDASDFVIATPAEMVEQERGGTWSTICYARRAGKRLVVVYPDGTTKETP